MQPGVLGAQSVDGRPDPADRAVIKIVVAEHEENVGIGGLLDADQIMGQIVAFGHVAADHQPIEIEPGQIPEKRVAILAGQEIKMNVGGPGDAFHANQATEQSQDAEPPSNRTAARPRGRREGYLRCAVDSSRVRVLLRSAGQNAVSPRPHGWVPV